MNRWRKRQGYLIAVAGVSLVLLVRSFLHTTLDEQALLLPFVLAVMASAWRGGLGPGLAATTLGLFTAAYFFVPPLGSFRIERLDHVVGALVFVVIGATISGLCEALHRLQRRETEKQFRTLADSIPQLVWIARPDGFRFWHNQQWYDYTGTDRQQVEGWRWQSLLDADQRPQVLASWRTALANGQPWEDTFRLRRRDGVMRWQLARARPLRSESGEIECWFGTLTDVTERLETEQALKEADRCKDEFLATLAHELRNPLSPIANALELWPLIASNPQELEDLRETMQRQVHQMTRLIDDLMDVSRIRHGRISLRFENVEVASLIQRAVEENQELLESREDQLRIEQPPDPTVIRGDAARLTQVVANLLNNAAKYSPSGSPIWIRVTKDKDYVRLSVRDRGAGIAPAMLDKVFDLFAQVDRTLDRSQGGLGIGLTLVKRLVELHGGTIEAHSEGTDRGSEFVVTLPTACQPDEPESHSPSAEAPQPPELPELPRHKLLVVDDEPAAADMVARLLRSMNQDVSVVLEPDAVYPFVCAEHPDAVFLDLAMPGTSGHDLAKRFRHSAEFAHLPLIALTGFGREEDRREAFRAGFDFHLTKPAYREELANVLRQLETVATAGKDAEARNARPC